jgi:hypothetical protein
MHQKFHKKAAKKQSATFEDTLEEAIALEEKGERYVDGPKVKYLYPINYTQCNEN